MINKFLYILEVFLVCLFFSINANANVIKFNFDVKEVEILENGNIFKGLKRGKATTTDGITIEANTFTYNKTTNIFRAKGNIIFTDKINDLKIFSENATYYKNDEILITENNSKAISNDGNIITGNKFKYEKIKNLFYASGNVEIKNIKKNYAISTDQITYFKNDEKIITKGKTNSLIKSKYKIDSSNVTFLVKDEKLISNNKTKIQDKNSNIYFIDQFSYLIKTEILKGKNILIITNNDSIKSDKYYFSNAIINLSKLNFVSKDPKIYVHKNIFDNSENDPRLFGSSAKKEGSVTVIKNGVFTSCKIQNGKCPPWKIQAKKITHNKDKKQLTYDHAVLKFFNIPIFYYPKFFHPDPTVERQSGFLQPRLNNSKILGSSIHLPYYYVLDQNKDFTLKTTMFDKDILMLQNEYREVNKNSNIEIDYAFTNGYKSNLSKKNSSIYHLFSKINLDLNYENFSKSEININIEKTNNDTYLKIFDNILTGSPLKPNNPNILNSEVKIELNKNNFYFDAGLKSYEDLRLANSDRYQYILPYYNFSKNIPQDIINGSINFGSSGNNSLIDTNNLKSSIINNLNFLGDNIISNSGLKNNFNIYLKNLNTIGKKSTIYKEEPRMELMSIYELKTELPLIKKNDKYIDNIIPKFSYRFNPSDMSNHSDIEREINNDNIFNINRLGINDAFESGQSLTLGLDYKKESVKDSNEKYFEINLATVIRDKSSNEISKVTTLNKKRSNIFGSVKNKISKNWDLEYDFAINDKLNKVEKNSINTTISLNNFVTTFNFFEKNGSMGETNTIENTSKYLLDEKNSVSFKSRRNRKINLTEFYDLVYEYKNDCLTAGIKYRKTYYEDRELKPSEDLMFTVTFYPLTTYEQKISENLYN